MLCMADFRILACMWLGFPKTGAVRRPLEWPLLVGSRLVVCLFGSGGLSELEMLSFTFSNGSGQRWWFSYLAVPVGAQICSEVSLFEMGGLSFHTWCFSDQP